MPFLATSSRRRSVRAGDRRKGSPKRLRAEASVASAPSIRSTCASLRSSRSSATPTNTSKPPRLTSATRGVTGRFPPPGASRHDPADLAQFAAQDLVIKKSSRADPDSSPGSSGPERLPLDRQSLHVSRSRERASELHVTTKRGHASRASLRDDRDRSCSPHLIRRNPRQRSDPSPYDVLAAKRQQYRPLARGG